MKRSLQIVIQIAFLALFIFLLVKGKAQLWMRIFLLGILGSFLLGRIYCGWFCSINTVLKGVTWIKKKLHMKSLKSPQFLTKPWVRFLAFGLFVTVFIFMYVLLKLLKKMKNIISLRENVLSAWNAPEVASKTP